MWKLNNSEILKKSRKLGEKVAHWHHPVNVQRHSILIRGGGLEAIAGSAGFQSRVGEVGVLSRGSGCN